MSLLPFQEKISRTIEKFIRKPILGLDFSDQSIKYISFREEKKLTVDDFGDIVLPPGVIVKGEVMKEDELLKTLSSWLEGKGKRFRSYSIAASLPEEKGFVRLIKLPKVKQDDLRNAIQWELEANIPIPKDQLVYDYEVVEPREGTTLDHTDVVVIAFPIAMLQPYLRVLQTLGFEIAAFELEGQAIIRAVVANLDDRQARVIVDMGRNRTGLTIAVGGMIISTSTIELGGKLLEGNIMKVAGVTEEKAIEIKKKIGLDKKSDDGKYFNALLPAAAVLADELKHTFDYYHAHTMHMHDASGAITKVLLTGGDANLIGLDTYLSSALKVPVLHGDPREGVRNILESPVLPVFKNVSLGYATAIGLALREVRMHENADSSQ